MLLRCDYVGTPRRVPFEISFSLTHTTRESIPSLTRGNFIHLEIQTLVPPHTTCVVQISNFRSSI